MVDRWVWRVVQGLYWLALGTWFGALIMLAMGAAATFKVMRTYHPLTLMPSLPVLGEQTVGSNENVATMLAGSIVGLMLDHLRILEMLCAGVLIFTTLLQLITFRRRLARDGVGQWMNTLRVALLIGAIGALAADTFYVNPRIKELRPAMHDAPEPAVRDALQVEFDRFHGYGVRLASMMILMLGVGALASGFVLDHSDLTAETQRRQDAEEAERKA